MYKIFWLENLKERDHSEDQGVYEKTNRVVRYGLDASGSG